MTEDRPMENAVLPDETESMGLRDVPYMVAVDVGTIPLGAAGVFGGMRIRWTMLSDFNDHSTDSKTNLVFTHSGMVKDLIDDLTEILGKLKDPTPQPDTATTEAAQ